jgi:RNA polymerase sigma-70 factor (ECF subfamily)
LGPTDQELVAQVQAGDRKAFRTLVERYQRRAYAIAVGLLKSPDDAMDATQEAFVRVFTRIGGFKGDSSFYTWFYRIVVNVCIDHCRKHGRFKGVEYDDAVAHESDGEAPLPVTGNIDLLHPGRAVQNAELRAALDRALDTLSTNHRTIILLREVEGLSYEEIAEVCELHLGTVMSRLHHARKNLQIALKPYLEATGSRLADQAGEGVRRRS